MLDACENSKSGKCEKHCQYEPCKKSVAVLGFNCGRGCGFKYCITHRFPEEHKCKDFVKIIEKELEILKTNVKSC